MNLIDKYFKQNKNIKIVGILIGISLGIFLLTFILWELLFSRYYIFSQNEDLFQDAVEKYYQYREELLPKKGEIREVTLEKLFLEGRISELTVPKSKEVCDTDSWVRIYHNENGEYEYYTYLKCGHYESSIDHEGPQITLNGDLETIINYGQSYQELGVKKVVDNTDGEMDITKVEIDSSKVDTTKVGSYKVTYKIRDKMNNQTKVTRTVIVAKNLTEIVKEQTDESNYYKGKAINNYVQFSGMLWRIINVNSDGSVRIITDNPIANLRSEEENYKGSNVEDWLNNYFYPNINNSKNFVVDGTYCIGNLTSISDLSGACSETITSKIGLLNIQEIAATRGNTTSFLADGDLYLLANKVGNQLVVSSNSNLEGYMLTENNKIPSIKPVINLKNNLFIVSGDGTLDRPYKLNDYSYGKEHDKLNTRIVGEYINYSGMVARIIGIEDGNVRVILAQPLMNNTTNTALTVALRDAENVKFNIKEKNNHGYLLNDDYIDYISETNIVSTKYKIPINVSGKKYSEYETETITAKLVLPTTYELFSSVDNSSLSKRYRYLYIDNSAIKDCIFMLSSTNSLVFELLKDNFNPFALKPVFTLNGNLKIKSGNGTVNSPYYLR